MAKSKSNKKPATLYERLDRLRERFDLTDTQLAELLGMSRQQYSNMKVKEQRVTKAWEIALTAMEKYGVAFLK